jgi:hypothetical protein
MGLIMDYETAIDVLNTPGDLSEENVLAIAKLMHEFGRKHEFCKIFKIWRVLENLGSGNTISAKLWQLIPYICDLMIAGSTRVYNKPISIPLWEETLAGLNVKQ